MDVTEERFRVMASHTEVLLVEPVPRAAGYARRRLVEMEARWSRFVATSEISQLNSAGGEWVTISNDTIRLIEAMQAAHRVTDGRYDPTFLHHLLSVGYTASIDDPDRMTLAVHTRSADLDIHDAEIDRSRSRVRLPAGLSIDPGGIGKGFAADLVVTELLATGTLGALVSVGGDIAAAGCAPDDSGWLVHVEDPLDPSRHLVTLAVSAGGVATSSTRSRRWVHDGAEHHHVIDPITGAESLTDLAAVTVIANSGWLAEAQATSGLLIGGSRVIDELTARGLSGLAVGIDGVMRSTPDILLEGVL